MLRIGLAPCDLGLRWSCRSGVNTTPDLQDGPFVVTLVVIMIWKDTTFQVLYIFYLLCAWNITTVKIKSGVYLLIS